MSLIDWEENHYPIGKSVSEKSAQSRQLKLAVNLTEGAFNIKPRDKDSPKTLFDDVLKASSTQVWSPLKVSSGSALERRSNQEKGDFVILESLVIRQRRLGKPRKILFSVCKLIPFVPLPPTLDFTATQNKSNLIAKNQRWYLTALWIFLISIDHTKWLLKLSTKQNMAYSQPTPTPGFHKTDFVKEHL